MKSNIIKIFVLFQIFSISYGQLLVPENFAQLNTLHVLFKWEQICAGPVSFEIIYLAE